MGTRIGVGTSAFSHHRLFRRAEDKNQNGIGCERMAIQRGGHELPIGRCVNCLRRERWNIAQRLGVLRHARVIQGRNVPPHLDVRYVPRFRDRDIQNHGSEGGAGRLAQSSALRSSVTHSFNVCQPALRGRS